MAITYTGATGLFTHLGALIARINSYVTLGVTTLPADLQALLTAFGTTNAGWLPEEGIAGAYDSLRDQVTGWRQLLASFADRRVTDLATVIAQLSLSPGPGAGLDTVLAGLRRQMTLDAQSIDASTCTVGSVAAVSGNSGTGTAYVTDVLDGFNPPLQGGAADVYYSGLLTQLTVPSETMTLQCESDSSQDGASEGGESFSWTGGPAYPDLDVRTEGSGAGPTLQVANGSGNLLANGDMETFASNVPTSWSVESGTAGTHVLENSVAANVFRGSKSLRFAGDAAATIRVAQSFGAGTLQGRRRYLVGAAIKASATSAPATLTIQFAGTGYTAGASEKITIAGGSLPTSWTLYSFWITLPAVMASDWRLTAEITLLGAGVSVYFDSLCLAPAVYHGGVGCVIVAGATRWLKHDRLTFTLANNAAGLFQEFARKHWKCQLPSNDAGAETISDGLVV